MAVKINIDTLFIVNTECASKSTKQRVDLRVTKFSGVLWLAI